MVARITMINCQECGAAMRMMRVPGYTSLLWVSEVHECKPEQIVKRYLNKMNKGEEKYGFGFKREGRRKYVYGSELLMERIEKMREKGETEKKVAEYTAQEWWIEKRANEEREREREKNKGKK